MVKGGVSGNLKKKKKMQPQFMCGNFVGCERRIDCPETGKEIRCGAVVVANVPGM